MKRALFRKAEQLVRKCLSECFIVIYNKESEKTFSFTTNQSFNLEEVTSLIYKDVKEGALL
jgi:hypothetical protein